MTGSSVGTAPVADSPSSTACRAVQGLHPSSKAASPHNDNGTALLKDSGKYFARAFPPLSPMERASFPSSKACAGMQFALLPCEHPDAVQLRPGQLTVCRRLRSQDSKDSDPCAVLMSTAPTEATAQFKLAPAGSGFGSHGLLLAGTSFGSGKFGNPAEHAKRRGSSSSSSGGISAANASSAGCPCNSDNSSVGSSSHCSNSVGRHTHRKPAPGSLLAVSTLTEVLQLCPFTGDASAGALMLATAASFTALTKTTKGGQLTGSAGQSGTANTQQQIRWK